MHSVTVVLCPESTTDYWFINTEVFFLISEHFLVFRAIFQRRCCRNFGRIWGKLVGGSFLRVAWFLSMNNQNGPEFTPFHFTQRIRINVHVDRKIFFQQRMVFMFGPERLREIMASPLPVVIPMINYENSFDVHVFILFWSIIYIKVFKKVKWWTVSIFSRKCHRGFSQGIEVEWQWHFPTQSFMAEVMRALKSS